MLYQMGSVIGCSRRNLVSIFSGYLIEDTRISLLGNPQKVLLGWESGKVLGIHHAVVVNWMDEQERKTTEVNALTQLNGKGLFRCQLLIVYHHAISGTQIREII